MPLQPTSRQPCHDGSMHGSFYELVSVVRCAVYRRRSLGHCLRTLMLGKMLLVRAVPRWSDKGGPDCEGCGYLVGQ